MEVDFLILADGAQVAGEKLYVLGGGWTIVWGRDFPVSHTGALAVGMMVDWQETNHRHQMQVLLLSEDGAQVGEPLVTGDFEVGRPPGMAPGTSQRCMFAATLAFNLERPGRYEVVVRIDGGDMRRAPFAAMQVQAAPIS